jgi:hypothetical protein
MILSAVLCIITALSHFTAIYGVVLVQTSFGPRTFTGGDSDCSQFYVASDVDTSSITITGSLDYSESTGDSFSSDFEVIYTVNLFYMIGNTHVFLNVGGTLGWSRKSCALWWL